MFDSRLSGRSAFSKCEREDKYKNCRIDFFFFLKMGTRGKKASAKYITGVFLCLIRREELAVEALLGGSGVASTLPALLHFFLKGTFGDRRHYFQFTVKKGSRRGNFPAAVVHSGHWDKTPRAGWLINKGV